jgi:hypothetical protein
MRSEFESAKRKMRLIRVQFLVSEVVLEGCFDLDAIRYAFHLRASLREYCCRDQSMHIC